MTFKFEPKSDEELQMSSLLPKGQYNFIIQKAEEKMSSSGNVMIELFLEIFDSEGGSAYVADYLVNHEKMAWKLKHFCQAVNVMDQYNSGSLNANSLHNKEGMAIVDIEQKKINPETGEEYKPKNKIKDYIVNKTEKLSESNQPRQPLTEDDFDDINF